MRNPVNTTSNPIKARRMLKKQYRQLGSYAALSRAREISVSHVYRFLVYGKLPVSRKLQLKLGLRAHHPVTINQLLKLPIQEQPVEILRLAFENREEIW